MTEFQRAALLRLLSARDSCRRLGKPLPRELALRTLAKKFGLKISEILVLEKERTG